MTQRLLLLLIGLVALISPAVAQERTPPTPVAITTGEGIVNAAPDRAFVNITAESRAANPREAQRRNVELMKPVLDKLRGAGLPAEAIRTVQYDLQQEWDYVNNRRVSRGYVARNTVEVRVDGLDRLGEILEIAVSAGATSVGDIRFEVKERAKLEQQALKLAVADARARAEAAASGAGQTIARILRIEEHGVIAPPQPPMPMMRTTARDEAAQAAVPISAGTMELRARVTLTCELR